MEEKNIEYYENSLLKDRSMWLSMAASWMSFILNFAVSFYLTPYLIRSVGQAEYSFYPLVGAFISYISVLTLALNSMQSRFVVIALHRKETQKAIEYINAVFFTNLIFSIVLLPIGIFYIYNIDKFLNVPENVKTNVQILFSFVLCSFIIGLLTNFYGMATYYKDKLYLSSFVTMVATIIKVGVGILLFSLLPAKVYYVSLMEFSTFLVGLTFNYYFTKKFMPDINISYKYFRTDRLKELMSSGVWNSVSQLSNMLLTGIDLLLANIYLGPASVAMISVSKTLPNNVCSLISVAGGIFQPRFARQFAHNDIHSLYNSLKSSIRLLGLVACIPMGALLAVGVYFFRLWVPTMDAKVLQILSIMAVSTLCISITIQPIYSIFIITNKVKMNSLVVLGTSVLNIVLVLLFLKLTDVQFYRMIIIVFTSEVIGITRNLFFTIPYAAKCIGVNWIDFFKVVLRNMALLGMCVVIFYLLSFVIMPNSWIMFIVNVLIGSVISIFILWWIALNKNERILIKETVFNKLKSIFKYFLGDTYENIGIISIHRYKNWGSVLQNYALQKYLKKDNNYVKTIDYIPYIDNNICYNINDYFKYFLNKKYIKSFLSCVKITISQKYNTKLLLKFLKKYISVTKTCYNFKDINKLKFNTVILGSNQIWKFPIENSLFFGYNIKADKIISYAPSLGVDKYTEAEEKQIKKYKDIYKAISVREEKSAKYLSELLNRKVECVCDPVFLLDKLDYEKIIDKPKEKINNKYILIYLLYDIDKNQLIINIANKLKEKYGYEIINISIDKQYIENSKNIYGIGPCEFLYLMNNAEYIITNSFHGTCFSVIFEKNFYSVAFNEPCRLENILEKAKISERLISDINNLSYENINYFEVNNKLKPFIEKSKKFLEDNLK